jgi:hypothetical protein
MAAQQCVYPGCRTKVQDEAEGRASQWCGEHREKTCNMPGCADAIIPQSAFCQVDNDHVIFMEAVHVRWHQQADQLAQYQGAMRDVMGGGNGQLVIRKR